MRFKTLFTVIVLSLLLIPTMAQEMTPHTLTFDGYSFSYPPSMAHLVSIVAYPGDAADMEYPGGPEPRNTEFLLYRYTHLATPGSYRPAFRLRFYQTVDFAGYKQHERHLAQLQTLLKERPDLAAFERIHIDEAAYLPSLPLSAAQRVLQTQTAYIETEEFVGIRYVTVYQQESDTLLNEAFVYTFQGLSKDGTTYVSFIAHLKTALFPADRLADFREDAFFAEGDGPLIDTLNTAKPDDFTPSLTEIDANLNGIRMQES